MADEPFEAALARLANPAYTAAPTGELRWGATTVIVPASYDPARPHPVRVFLHGGLSRRPDDPHRAKPLTFTDRYLAVYPSGSTEDPWWSHRQLANLRESLGRLKRSYNVDDNRVQLIGVSDGATGALFAAMTDPTPWSSIVSLNGFIRVLATRVDGELFAGNLANRPIYAINGERDPLYPARAVAPYMTMLERAGADVTFRALAGAGHDTSWWPREMPAIDAFEVAHPRDPLPEALSWQTARADRDNRIAWLVIDRLDPAGAAADHDTVELADDDFGIRVRGAGRELVDVIAGSAAAAIGLAPGDTIVAIDGARIDTAHDVADALDARPPATSLVVEVDRRGTTLVLEGVYPRPPRREIAFAHARPAGRVDVCRRDNTFHATTRGVAAFTLLLSPSAIDFGRPVTVIVNGAIAFAGVVAPSTATLLRHAAIDADRTMLFAAELALAVP